MKARSSQVFINIILNALDAMPDGGKLHDLRRDRERTTRAGTRSWSSSPIPASASPPMTWQRSSIPSTRPRKSGKGTGLGLSLSYNIIKRFKGDIKVDSEVRQGNDIHHHPSG